MTTSVRCGVAGAGPAGVRLGLLLARAGVDVLVLEKHADFLRDFRGDTIHPSTLEVMHELGLLDDLLRLLHQEVRRLGARVGDAEIVLADFTHRPPRARASHRPVVSLPRRVVPKTPDRGGSRPKFRRRR